MFDPSAHQNPLEAAIFNALTIAPRASEAIANLSHLYDAHSRRGAYALCAKIEVGKIFTDDDLDDIAVLLEPVNNTINQGWIEEIIPDEHCMSGSWINQRLTNETAELQHVSEPLRALHRALICVRNVRLAEHAALLMVRKLPK